MVRRQGGEQSSHLFGFEFDGGRLCWAAFTDHGYYYYVYQTYPKYSSLRQRQRQPL
jgi:hypothetical protein